jgi:hypothetical protein
MMGDAESPALTPEETSMAAPRPVVWSAAAAIALLATGCGGSASPPRTGPPTGPPTGLATDTPAVSATQPAPPESTCGTSHTAVNVPVIVEVEKGSVSCSVAMSVQNDYTQVIESGHVPGTGGGAPVKVDGWTCQGLATTAILQTGEATYCDKAGTEIITVLKTSGT